MKTHPAQHNAAPTHPDAPPPGASSPDGPSGGSRHPHSRTSGGVRTDLLVIAALGLICCIAYWPLIFHVFSLKNDALNYFLPVRFQVSEAIHNHEYPFWSPYFNLGYALHGDTQSGAWNPVVQLFSLFSPYSLYMLQLETVLYIFLSGVGMYFLLREWKINIYAVVFGATAYMLSGFNSDSCQFINWLSGSAYLPFVVLFYYKLLKKPSLLLSLSAGFSLWLLFVSAYPAQFITTLYLLLSMFGWHVYTQKKRSGITLLLSLRRALAKHIPFGLCFLLLSLPAILSYIQYLPLSERGSGASYADAMSNPLHPLLLFSWLTPLPIHTASFAAVTDNLERNSWFGVITLLFASTAFFIRSSDPGVRFAKTALLIFLVMSLGEYGGLRIIAYYILPLMNTFRHPAGLKLFSIFFSCILAAWSLDTWTHDKAQVRKVRTACLLCMTILGVLLLFSSPGAAGIWQKASSFFSTAKTQDLSTLAFSLKKFSDSLGFKELLFANALVQLLFLGLFYYIAVIRNDYKATVRLGILNCFFFTLLFLPATVVKKDAASAIQKILDKNTVDGYPLPSLVSSLAANSADGYRRFSEIGCLNMYNKRIGRVNYRISPCNLLSQNRFWFDTLARNTIMRYPLFYRTDSPLASLRNSSPITDSSSPRKPAPVNDNIPSHPGESLRPDSLASLSVLSFSPNHFVFRTRSATAGSYVLLQNYYPLWRCKIDGSEQPIKPAAISFMGLRVPSGEHTVEFLYGSKGLVLAFWLSVTGSLVLLVFFCYQGFSRSPGTNV